MCAYVVFVAFIIMFQRVSEFSVVRTVYSCAKMQVHPFCKFIGGGWGGGGGGGVL